MKKKKKLLKEIIFVILKNNTNENVFFSYLLRIFIVSEIQLLLAIFN